MNFSQKIKDKEVHVIGIAGQEGRAVLDFLLKVGVEKLHGHENTPRENFKKRFLSFSDAYTKKEAKTQVKRFLDSSAKLHFQDDYLGEIGKGDLVIVPQSYRRYRENQPLLEKAQKREIVLKQAIEVVFEIAPCPIIGVTGTVGKSTVAAVVYHILKKAGKRVYFSGNDREDKWDLVRLSKMPKEDLAVLEISNRHLIDLRASPHVGVLVNLYPHHLDDHGSFEEYVKVKKRIFAYQGKEDFVVINKNLIKKGLVKKEEIKGKLRTFSLIDKSDAFVRDDVLYLIKEGRETKVSSISSLPVKGDHNLQNFLAASLACYVVGTPVEEIRKGLLSFKGLRFRQEYIGEFAGRKVYNDGKATDPIATIQAVAAMPQIDILLLAGVREGFKKGDFEMLAQKLATKGVKKIIICGASRNQIYNELKEKVEKGKLLKVEKLKKGVELACKFSQRGEMIVFSPACQSFDEFSDYRERALKFEEYISSLGRREVEKD